MTPIGIAAMGQGFAQTVAPVGILILLFDLIPDAAPKRWFSDGNV
jgi:hypothetical protein